MAALSREFGSSTAKQRQLLHRIKRRKGWTDDQLHDAVGVDSVTQLSAAGASATIKRLGGLDLPNPPGKKRSSYSRRTGSPCGPAVIRMIYDDHVQQIERLLGEYFDNPARADAWLLKNFKVETVRDLLTAARAAQVIQVLKTMLARKRDPNRDRKGAANVGQVADLPAQQAADQSPKRKRGVSSSSQRSTRPCSR